jgi:hypothetical protein
MPASYIRFDTEADYREAIESVLTVATENVRVLDWDLAPMKLESPTYSTLIQAMFHRNPSASVHTAVHDPDFVTRHAPRLIELHELHLERVEIRVLPESLQGLTDCHVLADGKHGARRFHKDFPRGALFLDNPVEAAPWWKRFDELWASCSPVALGRRTGL